MYTSKCNRVRYLVHNRLATDCLKVRSVAVQFTDSNCINGIVMLQLHKDRLACIRCICIWVDTKIKGDETIRERINKPFNTFITITLTTLKQCVSNFNSISFHVMSPTTFDKVKKSTVTDMASGIRLKEKLYTSSTGRARWEIIWRSFSISSWR